MENEADWPSVTVWLSGGAVIEGGASTVKVATALVRLAAEFVSTTK